MIRLEITIKEEESITFANNRTLATGMNVSLVEKGIKATEGEKKAFQYIKEKLNINEKIQFINESKNVGLEKFVKNLLK